MTVYTVLEVAQTLKVCRKTVEREIQRGRLKAKKVGSAWRVRDEALERYMGAK